MELTIAQGTATAALEASSLMWIVESNEPVTQYYKILMGKRASERTNCPERSQEAKDESKAIGPPVDCKIEKWEPVQKLWYS